MSELENEGPGLPDFLQIRTYSATSILKPVRHDGDQDMAWLEEINRDGWEIYAIFPPLWVYLRRRKE
jgi:hypothetical protein